MTYQTRSEEDIERIIQQSLASVQLEGLVVSQHAIDLARTALRGKITMDDAVARILEHHRKST